MVLYKINKHSISINGLYNDLDFHFVLKLQYYATLLCYACRVWNVLVTFQKPIIQGLWLIAVYDNRSGLLLQSCCRVFFLIFNCFSFCQAGSVCLLSYCGYMIQAINVLLVTSTMYFLELIDRLYVILWTHIVKYIGQL